MSSATAASARTATSDEKANFLRFVRSMAGDNKAASDKFTFQNKLSVSDLAWVNAQIAGIDGLFDTYMPTLRLSHVVDGADVIITCATKTPENKVEHVLNDIDFMIEHIDAPPLSILTLPTLHLSSLNEQLQEQSIALDDLSESIQRIAIHPQRPWWAGFFH